MGPTDVVMETEVVYGSSEVLVNCTLLPTVSTTCGWGHNLLLVGGLLGGATSHRGSTVIVESVASSGGTSASR